MAEAAHPSSSLLHGRAQAHGLKQLLANGGLPAGAGLGMRSIPQQCQMLYQGTLDAARKIVRREGLATLWRGTGPALVMAVPQVGIYLPTYEWLKKTLEDQQTSGSGSVFPVYVFCKTL